MLLTVLVSALGLALGTGLTPACDEAPKSKIRIGTYDNRSIAVAYAASKYNPVKEKMAAYRKAKDAGEKEKMKTLEEWGENHQRVLHFQGFGRVPVGDLLEPVKDQVRDLVKQKGLAAITMACDFASPDVELVDITDDLVKLFDPTDRTITMAKNIRSAKVVDLVELSNLPAKR